MLTGERDHISSSLIKVSPRPTTYVNSACSGETVLMRRLLGPWLYAYVITAFFFPMTRLIFCCIWIRISVRAICSPEVKKKKQKKKKNKKKTKKKKQKKNNKKSPPPPPPKKKKKKKKQKKKTKKKKNKTKKQKKHTHTHAVGCASDWRPGGHGFDPNRGRQHSFVEIDHEIFSTVFSPVR